MGEEYVPGVDEDAGEVYIDKLSGLPRRRRAHTGRKRKGPYSSEEDAAIAAFDKWLSVQRGMHGALAQRTCVDVTVWLAAITTVCERYSYENVPDVRGLNPHVVFDELDLDYADAPTVPVEEVDVFRDLR